MEQGKATRQVSIANWRYSLTFFFSSLYCFVHIEHLKDSPITYLSSTFTLWLFEVVLTVVLSSIVQVSLCLFVRMQYISDGKICIDFYQWGNVATLLCDSVVLFLVVECCIEYTVCLFKD